MNTENAISTAASISAVLAFLGVSARWLHRWFSRLENAVSVVEHRSQQLEANGGKSLRDDVRQIREVVDVHSQEFAEIHQTISSLAVTFAATAAGQSEEGS